MIPYGKQSISAMDIFRVSKQLISSSLTQGPMIKKFEDQFAKVVGAKFAVAVSNATAGLHIAVQALDIPKESQVATTPISFVSSANSILYAGYRPVFIDIDSKTINLDINQFKEIFYADSFNISAVIPVHFAGLPLDMKKLGDFCKKNRIPIIEDAAHALGARYETGEMIGSCTYSDMTVFSFHPVKTITTGEGGIVTTNSEILYKKLLRLRFI